MAVLGLFNMTDERIGRLLDRLDRVEEKSAAAQRQALAAAVLMIPNEAVTPTLQAVVKTLRAARGEAGGAT